MIMTDGTFHHGVSLTKLKELERTLAVNRKGIWYVPRWLKLLRPAGL